MRNFLNSIYVGLFFDVFPRKNSQKTRRTEGVRSFCYSHFQTNVLADFNDATWLLSGDVQLHPYVITSNCQNSTL